MKKRKILLSMFILIFIGVIALTITSCGKPKDNSNLPDNPDNPLNPDNPDVPDNPDNPDTPTVKDIKVTFNPDGGLMKDVLEINTKSGQKIQKPTDPIKIGCEFLNWENENGEVFDFTKPLNENKNLTAKYRVDNRTYSIRFNSQGGSDVAPVEGLKRNETGTAPDTPTRDKYEFVEWVLNGKTYDFTAPVTSNITLVAKWELAKVTVSFETNGGSIVPTQKIEAGTKATEPGRPTKANAEFLGWYDNEECEGNPYDFNTLLDRSMTLYAKWENSFNVTFINEEGSYSYHKSIVLTIKENQSSYDAFHANEYLVTPDSGFNHPHFVFIGWYDSENNLFDENKPVTSNMTLYAKWDKYYTVTFSNSNVAEQVVKTGEYAVRPDGSADKYGHPFDDWYYNGVFNFEETPIISNTVITARYKYFVSFNSTGGSDVEQQLVSYGNKATAPETPTKDHYYFLGWYNEGKEFNFNATDITSDITLTARWIYTIVGEGTKESPFILENKSDILMFSELVNKDAQHPVNGTVYRTAYYQVKNDIDFENEILEPVSNFSGTFDGIGNSIQNIQIETANSANIGFFANLVNATVTNLTLDNITITGNQATNANVGILAGKTIGTSITGVKVTGSIILNPNRMERATLGGLVGQMEKTNVYAAHITAIIKGGNLVGGIAGYVKNNTTIASSYVSNASTLQLYRTGVLAGLVGEVKETSLVVSCYTEANLLDSIYTAKADSKNNAYGFGEGKFVNCYFGNLDYSTLEWNQEDWNLDDLTLKLIPLEHDDISITIGVYENDEFVEVSTNTYSFGEIAELDSIEGPAGYVFIGYKTIDNKVIDQNIPFYHNMTLTPYYEQYDVMLGKWVDTESEWFELSVNDAGNIIAKASIYTGSYDITGSNFTEIPLLYRESKYEKLEYIVYDYYGYPSITGRYYDGIVIYFIVRSNITGVEDENYRAYLQRVEANDYDKAFMRLEKQNKDKWETINDLMLPFASNYSGYYLEDGTKESFFVKAPYIPNNGNYNQAPYYDAVTDDSKITYSPFLFFGLEGFEDGVLGFTTESSTGVLGDYILISDGNLRKIYDYKDYKNVSLDYFESFEYLNAHWFNENAAFEEAYNHISEFNPKDPYHVYEFTEYNHIIFVDEVSKTIEIDGQSYTYEKKLNDAGVQVLSYTDALNNIHYLWADYEYNFLTGISYFVSYECEKANGSIIQEQWNKYDLATRKIWVEDKPDEGQEALNLGNIKLTGTTIQIGDNEPVDYDFVFITNCDGIPGLEITSFEYLRFNLNGTTYYIREYSFTGFVYFYADIPTNPGHLFSRRFVDEQSFAYYDRGYRGDWISVEGVNELNVDIENKTINGNPFEYSWYYPTAYDEEIFGYNTRFYTYVANYMDGETEYQFRATYIRQGYGYLFKKEGNNYILVSEYFSKAILDSLLGTWTYYYGTGENTIEVTFDDSIGYVVYYNHQLMDSHLVWNGYNGKPVVSFKLDDGEKVENLHLVYRGEYGYDLLDVLDYDSYDAVYDESEEDMVYTYTTKYLYFKDTTIQNVIEEMSGTWTDGKISVTIKSDEILVTEPGYSPVTLSIAYIYDLPSAFMDQYVIIMVGIDGDGEANYMFYLYNYYMSMTHFISDESQTGGSLISRDDIMVFRGNFTSVSLEETHTITYDGTNLTVDGYSYDSEYLQFTYAQMNDGRIVPVLSFSDVISLNETNLTAVLRSGELYFVDGVMIVNLIDTHLTLSVSSIGISIESYDYVENLLSQEIFYSQDILIYNGVYEFNNETDCLAINDSYVYVNGTKIDADILVLTNGSIQVIFEHNGSTYYAMIGLDAYGQMVYQIFKMSVVS